MVTILEVSELETDCLIFIIKTKIEETKLAKMAVNTPRYVCYIKINYNFIIY